MSKPRNIMLPNMPAPDRLLERATQQSELQGGGNILRHVAIIMDGNGRWAKARGLDREEGHKAGVEAAREIMMAAKDIGLTHLTLYSFSTENWRRPKREISYLMSLMRRFIDKDLNRLIKENIRVRILGDRKALSDDLRMLVNRAEIATAKNTGYVLQIAFNYGSRNEIARMTRKIAEQVAAGKILPDDIDENMVAGFLDTGDAPDPDLVIRTSGEMRISNFLLWQAAYSEFLFLDVLWPDFNREVFMAAIENYRGRERRFGGRKED